MAFEVKNFISKFLKNNHRHHNIDTPIMSGSFYNCYSDIYGYHIFKFLVRKITNIFSDVVINYVGGNHSVYLKFKSFLEIYGRLCMDRIYKNGFVVIGINKITGDITVLNDCDYQYVISWNSLNPKSLNECIDAYLLYDGLFFDERISHYQECLPFLKYIDICLNSGKSILEVNGNFIAVSPKAKNEFNQMDEPLSEEDREEAERRLSNYGNQRKQKGLAFFDIPVDIRVIDKTSSSSNMMPVLNKMVEVICDCLDLPANQVAMLDGTYNSTFSNGTEIREGDSLRYATFERMFNEIFLSMAFKLGISINYKISNKPLTDKIDVSVQGFETVK